VSKNSVRKSLPLDLLIIQHYQTLNAYFNGTISTVIISKTYRMVMFSFGELQLK